MGNFKNILTSFVYLLILFPSGFFFSGSSLFCEAKNETDDVKVLTDDTFDKFLTENKLVMVKFYADWCVHCKNLAPEYSKAAKMLKDEKSDVVFAKVRNEEGVNLMERFNVRGFPTLYFFKNGTEVEYSGSRDAPGLVSWVKELSTPGVKFVEDPSVLPMDKVFVVSYSDYSLSDLDSGSVSPLFLKFVRESDKYRSYFSFFNLAHTHKDKSSWNKWRTTEEWSKWKEFSQKHSDLKELTEALSKQEEEYKDKDMKEEYVVHQPSEGFTRFEGSTEDELEKFLSRETLPLFAEIDQENYMRFITSGMDLVWFCGTKSDYDKYKDVFTKVARVLRHQSTFVWVDSDKFGTIKEVFLLTQLPAVAYQTPTGRYLLQPNQQQSVKEAKSYNFDTFDSLLDFYHDVKMGLVPKSVRSEEEPKENDGPVKVVVGNTLEKLFDSKKNVLLMIHAPHCQHCKNFLPVYTEFATVNKDNDSLIVASFNGDANESSMEEVNWDSFPTLLYFKAGERVPVKFAGERTAEGLREFVTQNGGFVEDIHTEL
ncbi:Thioredoxin family protein [Theileria parva strain Muguga]|uniref:Protein disulfide isomerase, putative n=1 Tax=Theileria parva TaxID=5875 RepID=Q4MZU0_THEPA|nr:Thioredoxin family protein [Theileria parva strain Muguga]EAN31157.1 Thioredoxin family protein [Theileria parva strain Muguga]|eukprot:XP_763440.1 protein disulfide isomerase [Theileria parva strain Muguga]